ncbi:MAG: nucleotide exchange factor GrpE [Candidatus Moraniibacteriota bacterium]
MTEKKHDHSQHQHHAMFQLSQKVVLYDAMTKKFLLVRDAHPEFEFYKKYGPWDLPGGRVHAGEDPAEAIGRELQEEIGDVSYELKEVVTGCLMQVTRDGRVVDRTVLFSLALYTGGEPKLSDEHDRFEWRDLEAIENDSECKEWLKNAVAAALMRVKAQEGASDVLRILADFENFKKRVKNDEKELYGHLTSQIVTELIPVLDNFHAATEHVPADAAGSPWVTGITYIEKQFEDVLANYGVTPLEVKPGDAFDPTQHEALSMTNNQPLTTHDEKDNSDQEQESSVVGRQLIMKVVQKGYQIKGKLVRPAKVIVS